MKNTKYITIALVILFSFSACKSLDIGDIASNITTDDINTAIDITAKIYKSFEDITPEQEYYIGRAVGATILQKYKPYNNSAANNYVNVLGQTLSGFSDRPVLFGGYHFLVLDSDDINAFATPSGLVFISRGLLQCTTSEDGVAAILAHEIAHIQLKHGLKAIKNSRYADLGTTLAAAAAKKAGSKEVKELTTKFEGTISDIAKDMINKGYSRDSEYEADKIAVKILKRTGYDPHALVDMLEVMNTKLKPGGLDFSKTHPKPKDRISRVKREIGSYKAKLQPSAERQQRYKQFMETI